MTDNDHVPEVSVPAADGFRFRSLRADLWTARAQPMPPMAWPRGLRWLPQVLVGLGAAALAVTGADATAMLLAGGHAAMLLVGLRRPVPAWWLSMGFTVAIVVGHPPTHDNRLWVWVVTAGTLFLLALRVPISSAAVAALLSSALAFALKAAGCAVGSWTWFTVLFALAVLVGSFARARREDRARLVEQIAVTAHERALRTVLEERARIARELHDVVAHHMSVISIQADAAPYRVQDPQPELVKELASIRANAQEGLAELRHMLGLLRSPGPGESPEGTAPQPSLAQLDTLLVTVRSAGLPVTAQVRGTRRPLPPGVELSGYRIVQEALSNALRHAPGAEALVQLSYTGAGLHLRVVNTRASRAPAPSPGAGHGLTGMRERAVMLGGDFAAGPTPDGGYAVAATLPALSPTPDEEASP
ncbi:histidine kinase [Streptomyces sp. NBC_01565]|uniref:sensor histidine kinase n=1 Tax=unclassified Streptomyces TaxID=2593676 RepID=UPI00225B8577|nr:histidine kinase [Streptomyces sp. NBC_01565]MCX4539458.1 histidine kinase [Streptomyces sp. NBC_01565]